MIAKIKGLIIEGNPEEIYAFYLFSKFDKYYEEDLKKQINQMRDNDFDILLNKLKNKFKED